MKLKSVFPMIAALLGLAAMPAVSHASATSTNPVPIPSKPAATYGAYVTDAYYGSVRVFTLSGKLCTQDFWIEGYGTGYWSATLYCLNKMSVTVDASLNLHSVVTACTYFTDDQHKNQPSVATIDVTIPAAGPQTMGVQITDYFKPATVLYTSGKASDGSLLELPVNQGGFTIAH